MNNAKSWNISSLALTTRVDWQMRRYTIQKRKMKSDKSSSFFARSINIYYIFDCSCHYMWFRDPKLILLPPVIPPALCPSSWGTRCCSRTWRCCSSQNADAWLRRDRTPVGRSINPSNHHRFPQPRLRASQLDSTSLLARAFSRYTCDNPPTLTLRPPLADPWSIEIESRSHVRAPARDKRGALEASANPHDDFGASCL